MHFSVPCHHSHLGNIARTCHCGWIRLYSKVIVAGCLCISLLLILLSCFCCLPALPIEVS